MIEQARRQRELGQDNASVSMPCSEAWDRRCMQSPIRKIPLVTRQLLREELNRLEQLDIIAKVDKPTDWVSSLVLVILWTVLFSNFNAPTEI